MQRKIAHVSQSKPVMEGAGVRLKRAFGSNEVPRFDPFLLLDDFRSDNPKDYLKGFPWHPHRGIETITYVLSGDVEHGDSLGNKGTIGSGDVQWMTAGSGIIHQEMPKGDQNGRMHGFQLWANLPAAQKMVAPCYRDVTAAQIPEVSLDDDTRIKIICGQIGDTTGPVHDIVIEPQYLDVTVPAQTTYRHKTVKGHTVFAHVIGGQGCFSDNEETLFGDGQLVLFGDGDTLTATAGDASFKFLLISGKPLKEPVAWSGPIVMNTQKELKLAFDQYNKGTFIQSAT
jgi:quercetin 2,3-dioxygenase